MFNSIIRLKRWFLSTFYAREPIAVIMSLVLKGTSNFKSSSSH